VAAVPALALALVAFAGSELWSAGIPVPLSRSPVQVDRVASRWVAEFDYTTNRPSGITFSDCVVLVNRSSSVAMTRAQVVFGAVDPDGVPKRPNLMLEVRKPLEPGQSAPIYSTCLAHGYANGDRGLWLVAWISEAHFADGTSWHGPADEELLLQIASAVRAHGAHR
jgi:hypothetical protein